MAENVVYNPPIHLQAGLTKVGDMTVGTRPTRDRSGRPKMCRVVSVDRVHGRVNVTNEQSKSPNKRSVHSPGGETVQLPVKYYGVNTTGQIFGNFPYVGVGERVLVVNINNDASMPVVVAAYPDNGIEKHLTPTEPYKAMTNKDEYFDEFRAQKTVFPSQHVILHTGTGNYEHSLDGFSVIAQLNPGDYDDPPWRNDYFTGLPENTKHGITLNCFVDKSNDKLYPIQNNQAQDWVKIHQSHSDNDHHLTKRLIKQNGDTHNFWGSKLFKNNALTEDASVDKGYKLATRMGSLDLTGLRDNYRIVRYAKSQIGKHPYSNLTLNDVTGKKNTNQPLNNEIIYNPNPKSKKRGSSSNQLNFIWSVLHNTGMSVSSKPWTNISFMAMNLKSQKHGSAGDIVVLESDNYKKYQHVNLKKLGHEIPDTGVYFLRPYILEEDYKGYGTKIIGENKKAKNVTEIELGKVYTSLKWYQHLAFFSVPNMMTTGSSFELGNNNTIRLSVTDPNTTGYHRKNTFYLNKNYGSWRVMGHSITIDKNGVHIDGQLISQIIKPLHDKIVQLTKALNTLVYNLNDRNSRLSEKLTINQLLNQLNGQENNWHDYTDQFPSPKSDDTLITNCKKELGKPYSLQKLLQNCSGFVYGMLKKSDYKVPKNPYDLMTKPSFYLTPIESFDAKRNSILMYKDIHTAILLEPYHGNDTRIIQAGGSQSDINVSTIGDTLPTVDADDIKFYNPIPLNEPVHTFSMIPNDNDVLTVKDNDIVSKGLNRPITFDSGGASDLTYAVDTENMYNMITTKGSQNSNSEEASERADLLGYIQNIRSYRAIMNSISNDPHVPLDSQLAPEISSASNTVDSAQSLVDSEALDSALNSSEMSEASTAESSAASAERNADYQYIFASASFSSLSSVSSRSSFFSFSSNAHGLLEASQPTFDGNSTDYLKAKNNYLERQNNGLSKKYDKLVSTLKSSGILPKDY